MRYLDLKHIKNAKEINYSELQDKLEEIVVIAEVNEEVGKNIIELENIEGRFMFKEGDKYIAIDNSKGENWVEECACTPLAMRWLSGEIDTDELYRLNLEHEEDKKIREEYKKGNFPKYFDIKDKDVTGSLIKLNFDTELVSREFKQQEDGTFNGRFYWDYCEKFLKLCGCENIDMNEIMLRDDDRIFMELHLSMDAEKNEGILSVMFDDEYVNTEVEITLAKKGIKAPKIDRQFIIKKKFELSREKVFEVTPIDFH